MKKNIFRQYTCLYHLLVATFLPLLGSAQVTTITSSDADWTGNHSITGDLIIQDDFNITGSTGSKINIHVTGNVYIEPGHTVNMTHVNMFIGGHLQLQSQYNIISPTTPGAILNVDDCYFENNSGTYWEG